MSANHAAAVAVVVLAMCSVAGRVEAGCTVSTVGVDFGRYSVFVATALTSADTISLDCKGSDRKVSVSLSYGVSGTYVSRTLRGPGVDVLNYNLFLDAACTQIWGDGTVGTSLYFNPKPGNRFISLAVYGRITARQDVRAGVYRDTVVVSVMF